MTNDTIVGNDPVFRPRTRLNPLDRLGLHLINDVRDLPFIRHIVVLSLIVFTAAAYFYFAPSFPWWTAAIYLAVHFSVMLGPYILMLHNTSHRVLWKPKYSWMKGYIPNVLGPFFGETPNTYYVHHIGMHHPENNLHDDLSSTMPFDRDRLWHFARYVGRFYVLGVPELSKYMWVRRRFKLFRRAVGGEMIYIGLMLGLGIINWQATLVVFFLPLLFARFAMMAGNWAQHAFIDANDPSNPYRNSITCVNSSYTRRCFNDGYHIGHHVKANRHWTDMPGDFLANREKYAAEDSIVFQKVDFFIVWAMLMLKRYDWLASYYVNLGGPERSREELVRYMRIRTRRIPRESEQEAQAPAPAKERITLKRPSPVLEH
ncbi:MAG: fatty acid desaturase [bacterium]|nr:fatty acid desaturase [Candidatus Kapabacteria bacterium]